MHAARNAHEIENVVATILQENDVKKPHRSYLSAMSLDIASTTQLDDATRPSNLVRSNVERIRDSRHHDVDFQVILVYRLATVLATIY